MASRLVKILLSVGVMTTLATAACGGEVTSTPTQGPNLEGTVTAQQREIERLRGELGELKSRPTATPTPQPTYTPTPIPTPTPQPTYTPTPIPTPIPVLPQDYQIIKDGNRIPKKDGRTVGITPEGYDLMQKINVGGAYELNFERGFKGCQLIVWKPSPNRLERYDDNGCNGSVDAAWIGPELFIRDQRTLPESYWAQRDSEYRGWLLQMDLLEKILEQKSGLHRQLNPEKYGATGVLKPQYAPRKLGI